MQTKIKTTEEIDAMRKSGQMLAEVLEDLKKHLKPGIDTKQLAELASKKLKTLGGEPAFLGYHGFPDVLCVSINDEVVHGIPSVQRIINEGDIVGLDFGVKYKGMITDSAISLIAGQPSGQISSKLVKTTERALQSGIDQVKDGAKIGDIAAAIQRVIESQGFGVVRDLVGHGVGHELHEEPNIPNFGHPGTGQILKAGMTFAIEPMTTVGSYEVYTAKDGWTVRTRDHSLSAHFEHTVLVAKTGAEILTVAT